MTQSTDSLLRLLSTVSSLPGFADHYGASLHRTISAAVDGTPVQREEINLAIFREALALAKPYVEFAAAHVPAKMRREVQRDLDHIDHVLFGGHPPGPLNGR
jgi:hypothetical protein